MSTVARSRWIRLDFEFAAAFVACALFGLATASAQETTTKVQSYTELSGSDAASSRNRPGAKLDINLYLWRKSGGEDELRGIEGDPYPYAISANGEVVAGHYHVSKNSDNGIFLWSKTGGFRDIGRYHGYFRILCVSDDGSAVIWVDVVQTKDDIRLNRAKDGDVHLFRWTKTGGAKELVGIKSVVGSSADGSEMVGVSKDNSGEHAFRWTQQGGMQLLPQMDYPLAVSADGAVILGLKGHDVIHWTQAGGVKDLGTLQWDENVSTIPESASADAATIVGEMYVKGRDNAPTTTHAFVWTRAGGQQDLGTMGGYNVSMEAVSDDGTVVAGDIQDASNHVRHVVFVSPVADLLAKEEAKVKHEQTQKQAQVAAQAEQQAKTAALAADQQARYDKVIKTGRPIQLYSLAGDFEDEGRADLAANLYQVLIDKFPDDPYAAKAVDKKDAARAAAAQQQQQAQDAANQTTANAATAQNVEACIQQCTSTLNSCKSDAQNQHDAAVAKGLVGLISRNSGMVGGAGTDSQNADSAKSACDDAYNGCSSSCQQ